MTVPRVSSSRRAVPHICQPPSLPVLGWRKKHRAVWEWVVWNCDCGIAYRCEYDDPGNLFWTRYYGGSS